MAQTGGVPTPPSSVETAQRIRQTGGTLTSFAAAIHPFATHRRVIASRRPEQQAGRRARSRGNFIRPCMGRWTHRASDSDRAVAHRTQRMGWVGARMLDEGSQDRTATQTRPPFQQPSILLACFAPCPPGRSVRRQTHTHMCMPRCPSPSCQAPARHSRSGAQIQVGPVPLDADGAPCPVHAPRRPPSLLSACPFCTRDWCPGNRWPHTHSRRFPHPQRDSPSIIDPSLRGRQLVRAYCSVLTIGPCVMAG